MIEDRSNKRNLYPCIVFLLIAMCVLMVSVSFAVAPEKDQLEYPACQYCGMDRTRFAHSRTLVTYDDGTIVGTCSLHCLVLDLSIKIDKTPVVIMVADYNSKMLIDAETARWVIGGSKMGVMTKRAKWAFASEGDARSFVTAHGGSTGEFFVAAKAAFEDMYDDLRMIRAKRQKMKSKKDS